MPRIWRVLLVAAGLLGLVYALEGREAPVEAGRAAAPAERPAAPRRSGPLAPESPNPALAARDQRG